MPTLITAKEAAKLSGHSSDMIRYKIKPVKSDIGSTGRVLKHYYSLEDVLALSPPRYSKQKGYKSKVKLDEDPYGVMQKPTYRGRRCPVCKKLVPTGVYACKACWPKLQDSSDPTSPDYYEVYI